MNEQRFNHQTRNANVIQFPSRPAAEDPDEREDAYEALGGRLPSNDRPEVLPVHRIPSFFEVYKQTPDNAWQTEINRAYDLSLDEALQPEHIRQLAKKDADTVAAAGFDLYETLSHRAPLLLLDGNYENPLFAKYYFQSQEQASDYAGLMFALRQELDEQPIVRQLLKQHNEKYSQRKMPQAKLTEARQLQRISIDDDNKVVLQYSGTSFAAPRLHSVE